MLRPEASTGLQARVGQKAAAEAASTRDRIRIHACERRELR
jgi:hypothetical protein